MRKLKIFTFLLALLASVGMSWATSQPIGYVDVCTAHPGSIHLVGWANDPDALGTSLSIHVYVDQPNGGDSYINQHGYNLGTTDVWREDGVYPQYTGYHKIDRYINIMEASGAGTYRIRAYALDAVGNDGNPLMPHSYLNGMPTTATLTVPAPYSITYNANGGNGAPAADYKCYGIDKTLSSTVPTRDGYTFIGWNTEQNGSGTSYAKGATYSANASATLYAKWTANTYKVKFNGNGNTGGSMSDQNFTYGTAQNLTANAFSRTGYTFAGWATSSGGAKAYNDKQSVNNLTATNGGTINLYAVWTPIPYTTGSWMRVSYKTGRTNTPNATSGAISYNGFNGKTGGWGNISYIEDPNRGIGYQAAGNGKNSERKGVYSIYKNEQTIPSYSKRRMTGTFTLNSSDAKYKSTAALYAHNNQSELQSYSVDFTHGLKDGTGSSKRITYVVNETKNGSWKSSSANYTYDFDNSTGSAEATKGWYILLAHTIVTDAAYDSGVAEKASFKSTSENYTWYYYKYVTFDPNGGTGNMAVQTVENSAQLHHNAFSRTGYSFAGWNTQPDGNGTAYDNEAVITATATNKGPVTLYAQWTVHQYTISFDSNGGTPVASITQNYGTAVTPPANPTREDHTFIGWDAEIPTTMPAHNVHLVALWSNPAADMNAILTELYNALGDQVWTGYGAETGVISYSRGDDAEEFRASFMGGTYTIDLAFDDFIMAEKFDNGDGSHTYTLEVNLPAQITGMDHEILHVTVNSNGEITGITSVHAGAEMTKESDSAITSWAELQAAMTAGGIIKLTQDITAPANAEALEVPADKTVLLDLNGHIIDRALASAQENGSVIINNGVLAFMDETGNGKIKGGNTTGKGGGVYNNGTFTLYSGEITGNHADEMGGGVYNRISNSDTEGFWMTGGLIDGNTAGSYPAIEGEVAFNNLAVVQINATGTTVSVTTAKAHLDVYNYIKPVMPDLSMYAILAELYAALGDDVWTGYGANTGVISYSRGDEANEFRASFMGGTYTIDIPFGDFTAASKHEEGGKYIYDLTVSLPAQTGMSQETLHVTVNSNGEIEAIHSDGAEIDLKKETNNEITTWAQLQAAMNAGGMIKLTHDITAESTDAALEVPMNTTVMLDLNGHSIDRALTSAIANGSVIVNNGVLAIMDEAGNGKIKGGKTTGNGGGVLNNGIFTLYAGEITGNSAAQGGGVYNNGGAQGFWMTGGLIDNNTATNGNDAISGNVIFNNLAVVQVDANGTTVSPATAVAGLSHYSYIKPVMPDMEMYAILAELYAALGNDVWTGYGAHTGVISYSRGDEQNEFRATFMGGTYTIDIPFGDFTAASKAATAEGGAVYTLVVSLPAQTGMSQETLHVTVNSNGEIEAIHSDIAEIDLIKETNNEITTWAQLQAAMNAGGMIKLTHDITAENTDAALEVPANTTVMLDLNGHTIDRALTSAVADGSVIINNGVLAIMDETGNGKIKGGYNSGNGGGIVNNGTFTLYGGKITGNHAAQGAGVYNSVANNGTVGFWMTGGLIAENSASSYPAIKGDVTFSNLAVVQINAQGATVSAATAIAGLATYDYIKPVMPNMDMFAILAELHNALGNDVWAGYGEATGVITYAQGTEPNSFKATFMGGNYEIEIPFGDFTQAEKIDNNNGTYTYNLDVNLPAQTGLSHEVLHVTTNNNGEIVAIHSDIAQTDMNKVGGSIASWAALNAAVANGGVLQLSQSLTATNLDGALIVPAGKTVVLDLNGFSLDRHLASAQENGSVIINNGTLAIMGEGEIKGGYNSGNGGGIVNNGTFTLYGGKITGNHAAQGAGVYNSVANNGTVGFWMTGGLIAENSASSYPAIKGDVTFSNLAVVQINAQGATVSAATAIAGLATYDYIKPVMPNMDMFAILAELHNALGNDVWAGYGEATGVITYAQGTEPNSFKATFMGGNYEIEIPFGDFTQAEKIDNNNGTYTYNLDVNLPAQTGLSHEVLHVTTNNNGEIVAIHSDIAQTDMNKVGGSIASWAALNAAVANGGVLQLSQSLTATNLDGALIVPAGKTVVLDLNGFSLDRHLASAQADGCVIINNGTLAIMGEGEIKGGNNSDNGGGIVNNGTFTLYGGKITANHAAQGAGVYNSVANNGTVGFWMTGGLIDGNTASSYPAIKGDVTFSNLAVVQVNAGGTTVSTATAIAGLATYDYIRPIMPNMDMFAILAELHAALGNDVWTGYGVNTGVLSYAQGTEPNSFKATFMGGAYAIEIPFGDFTQAVKVDNGDGTYTYNLDVNLPAQTGLSHEVLHVTTNANGEITGIHSDIAQTDMNKVGGAIATWADLNAAMANGGVLQLSQSLTATNLDGALIVPNGKTVVLDLNGFSLDRHLTSAQADGCVIINNGTLAIMGEGEIKGGNNSDNGGGIVNNGTFTLYGGKITANHAAQGAGVYNSVANNGTVGFWMTGGLIDGNTASSYPAIKGDVTFSNLAVVQVNAGGTTVSTATAIAGLATYDYIRPIMPNMDMFAILAELHAALGNDVWTGYGVNTGVLSYAQGTEPNSFKATFMGGAYAIEIPFGDFTQAVKVDNGDGTYTYNLDVNLPAQTGLSHEVLHVTTNANGEILAMESENAGIELQKETDSAIATWNDLQNALNAGGIIKLTQNVENGDAPLVIPTGKTVVLNLNGHTINRGMTSAAENGSVIVNNGTLAVLDNSVSANGVITGGKTTGNGGGVLNNGTFTLYAGEIAGNEAAIGGGVYNNGGFWMTGGLIDNNTAGSYPAIGGDVTFNSKAAIQINSDETKVSIAMAKAGMETYSYIKPIMPDPENYYVVAATLTIPANSYATYFADKGLELALGTANGVVLTSVKAVNAIAGTLTLSNALESAAALTPLIIYNGTDEEQEVTLIVNENGAEVSYDKVHFFGTAAPQTFTAADMAAYDYYVLNGGQFVWVKDPGTLPANRCYLRLTKNVASGAPSFVINFGGDTTGIKEVKEVNNDSWHDLNGRKLQGVPTKKGVYINNGRKVVIR